MIEAVEHQGPIEEDEDKASALVTMPGGEGVKLKALVRKRRKRSRKQTFKPNLAGSSLEPVKIIGYGTGGGAYDGCSTTEDMLRVEVG